MQFLGSALLGVMCLLAAEATHASTSGDANTQYWSNLVPSRPAVPAPRQADRVFNPIDAFILSHLEARGLEPVDLAPKRTLLRRLSLDLTGLPPTPEEVRRFVINGDDHAYQLEVKRLLSSPRFGERMAQVWLDAVHYDQLRWEGNEAAFRAFVRDAFNRNMPFDEFTRKQLMASSAFDAQSGTAADASLLFGKPSGGRCVAADCQAKGIHDHAPLKVRILSEAWLGATLGCAQCHDHPYDPFAQDDFERMAAFFDRSGAAGVGLREGSRPALPPGFPACLTTEAERLPMSDAMDVEALAGWLTSRDQPRTARVFVNRLWREFFGRGLSKVVEDLGGGGEWPSHPELLDWLAVEFMESGWDVQHMVRLMVESFTYRQSSIPTSEALEKDPANRWLASQSPRPLDAAGMRDNALYLGGLLREDLKGASFRPFNLMDLLGEWKGEPSQPNASGGDAHHQRALYLDPRFVFLLKPTRSLFEAEGAGECPFTKAPPKPVRRNPMSDPIYLEASRGMARRLMEDASSDADRIRLAFEWVAVRPATRVEIKSLREMIKEQKRHYGEHPEEAVAMLAVSRATFSKALEPREWAAWIDVCQVLLNLEETSTRY